MGDGRVPIPAGWNDRRDLDSALEQQAPEGHPPRAAGEEARRPRYAKTTAAAAAAKRIQPSGAFIARRVNPDTTHHSTGMTSRGHRRPLARTRTAPIVAIAVGSGVTPKISNSRQSRPARSPAKG